MIVSDLVGNPEAQFSHLVAHFIPILSLHDTTEDKEELPIISDDSSELEIDDSNLQGRSTRAKAKGKGKGKFS